MRRVSHKVARFAAFAVASATAAGLIATLPPASQAASGLGATRHHATVARGPAVHAPASPNRLALARLMATQAQRRGRGLLTAPAGATSAAQVAAHSRTGILTGLVRSATGRPFGAACVSATGPAGRATARTRTNGRYLLTGLHPGRYQVRVSMCATPRRTVAGSPVISLWPGLPAAVSVRAGQMVTLTPATLEQVGQLPRPLPLSAAVKTKTGSISGLVTGNGKPLRDICVVAIPTTSGPIGIATTSKTGKYRITRLPPTVYQVQFASFGCSDRGNWLQQWYRGINSLFPTGKVANLRVRAGKNIPGINGKLKAGGEIAGTVRSKSGKKLGGICVSINGTIKDGGVGIGLVTNKTGFFAMHGLFPGHYTVEFTIGCGTKGNYAFQWWRGATNASRATTIKITGHTIAKNIDPTLAPGATIKGRVTGRSAAGPSLPGVCVNAIGDDGNFDAFAVTASNGRYQLEGLASGRYLIDFDPSCGPPATTSYLLTDRSTSVKGGQTLSGFNVFLAPGATISGKVTDAHGHPLDSVCVVIGDTNDDMTQTDSRGTYSITGIQPGSYLVGFFGGCGNKTSVAPQFYNDQPDPRSANPVKLIGGQTTANIDAVMKPGGTIAGVVTDPAGHRLNGICVGAVTIFGSQFPLDFADIDFTSQGHYRMDNLAPGRYQVEFSCDNQKFGAQWFNNQPDSTTADLLSVNAGVVTTVNAKLGLAGRIAGTVTNTAGHKLSDICVTVLNARNFTHIDVTQTLPFTNGGRYSIGGLNPGRYLVHFIDCTEHPRYGAQWYRDATTIASATRVIVKAGRTTAGINARLAVGGSISGVVTGPGNRPLRGICAEVFNSETGGFGTTDKRGHYTVSGLATGRYSIFFTPCAGGLPNLGSVTRPGLVTVTAPHAVTGIDIKLAPGGSVSGTVTSGAAPSQGLGEVCVLLSPTNPNGSFGFATTSRNGHYVANDLAPGTYHAFFGDPFCDFVNEGLGPFAPQWFNGQPTEATANDITVTAGHTTAGITAALQPYGSITGTVTNAAHAGVSGECVTAVPVGDAADPFSGEPPAPEVAESTSGGHYTLADLTAGRYKVEFSVGCGDAGFATQWWDNANSEKTASVITVAFTAIGGISATLHHQ